MLLHMPSTAKSLPTEEEILARFHRLRITIGLSATNFGYATMGSPGIIKRLTEGKKLQIKNRERCAYALDELEKGHSIPMQREAAVKPDGDGTTPRIDGAHIVADVGKIAAKTGQIVAQRSGMED